jgi:hypothetical protein
MRADVPGTPKRLRRARPRGVERERRAVRGYHRAALAAHLRERRARAERALPRPGPARRRDGHHEVRGRALAIPRRGSARVAALPVPRRPCEFGTSRRLRASGVRAKKKAGAGASVYTRPPSRGAQSLGSPAPRNCRSGSGGRTRCSLAAAIRVVETEAPSHPCTNAEVFLSIRTPRSADRPERRDSTDAMQGGPSPGGSGPPHGTAPNVPGVRLSLGVAPDRTASPMPRPRPRTFIRSGYELRNRTGGSEASFRRPGRVDSTIGARGRVHRGRRGPLPLAYSVDVPGCPAPCPAASYTLRRV